MQLGNPVLRIAPLYGVCHGSDSMENKIFFLPSSEYIGQGDVTY